LILNPGIILKDFLLTSAGIPFLSKSIIKSMVNIIMKISKNTLLLFTLPLLLLLNCSNINDPEKSGQIEEQRKDMGVILTPDTALRIDPLVFSARIKQMNKGTIVEILERSSEERTIGGHKDYWYKIKLENRLTGWTFGRHIKVLDASGKETLESYLGKFWEIETEELSTDLHGKWWSINRYGDFTNHALEIFKDGRYRSYFKGGGKVIEGVYNFDFNKNMVIFLSGTTFESDLNYIRKGNNHSLQRIEEKEEIRFKKINVNPSSEVEEYQQDNKKEDTPSGNNEDES